MALIIIDKDELLSAISNMSDAHEEWIQKQSDAKVAAKLYGKMRYDLFHLINYEAKEYDLTREEKTNEAD